VFAGLAAAAGKLGDVVGLKRLFIFGVVIFGLASLSAGFAQDGLWIITARAIQGIGAAVVFPSSMAMVTIAFPKEQRGFALGIYGAIGTVFLALGPLVGGFLTDVFSWRWIFWINPPIAAGIALMVAVAWVDPPREEATAKFDYMGLILLVSGLGLFVFALMQGPEWGWSESVILALLIAGLALFAAFVVVERRIGAPLIDVDLFGSATFSACNLVVFAAQFSKIAVIVFGAIYLQNALNMSPLEAGLALVAAVGPAPFTAALSGRLADRIGARIPTLAGLAAAGLALLWIGFAIVWNSYWLLLPALLIWGGASPFLFMPPQRAIMNAVPASKQGQAGGIAMTSQLLGGTIGMAVCGTLFVMTKDFRVVFLATAALMLAVLLIGWIAIERGTNETSR
ncbi:MAG: MFS transporter, partial [Geminicoccaceae bacterium]